MSGTYLVLIGVLVGYFLGFYFSGNQKINLFFTKEDLRRYMQAIDEAEETGELITAADIERKQFIKDGKFFRVHIPFFVFSTDPEAAYNQVKRGLKKLKGLFCACGAIDLNNVYVEKVSEEEVNNSYEDNK